MLGKYGLHYALSYGMIRFTSFRENSLCYHFLFLLGTLHQGSIERAEVLHPSDLLQSLLNLAKVLFTPRCDRQLKKCDLDLVVPAFC